MQIATSQDVSYAQPPLSASVNFTGAWPGVALFPLVLQDSEGAAPSMSNASGHLTVSLPAGTMMWIDYSSTLAAGAIAQMGWYQELAERYVNATDGAPDLATLVSKATAGQHWMFTPKRTIQLVHATLQPVQAPALAWLFVNRQPQGQAAAIPNATYAYVSGSLTAHSQSSAHVDVLAQWSEWDDSAGTWVQHGAKVVMAQLDYDDGAIEFADVKHELGDTKARLVSYTPIATTRYREYFPTSMTSDPAATSLAGPTLSGYVIPSTRRPPAPHPLYVLPSFLRTVSNGTSTRLGSTLRVYLNRPWYESGYGEQLAIVCRPASPPSGGTAAAFDQVTQLGLDPLWVGESPDVFLGTTVYDGGQSPTGMLASSIAIDPARAQLVSNYQLPDGTYVDLVVFNVDRSDPATDPRGLFFVDVTLPNAQFQMVSFQLARYQPSSIDAPTSLSDLARTAFSRISADRTATVTASATQVTISVTGPSASTQYRPTATTTGGGGSGGTGGNTGGGGGGTTNMAKLAGGKGPKRPSFTPPTPVTTPPTDQDLADAGAAGRYLQATLETTTNPAPADTDNELGWEQGPTTLLGPVVGKGSDPYVETVTWSGTLPLTRVAGTRYRVVIREFETRAADADVAQAPGTSTWMGTSPSTGNTLDALVYSDIVAFT